MSAIAQSQQLTVVLALWWPDDDADGHSCQRGLYFEISYLSTTILSTFRPSHQLPPGIEHTWCMCIKSSLG